MSVNWTKLVASGRAKDIGVSWNEEELESLVTIAQEKHRTFAEVAPFIREHGAITAEEYEEYVSVNPNAHSREEIEAKADDLGVAYSKDTPVTTLIAHIEKAAKKPAKKAEVKTTKKGAKKND